MNDKDYTSSIHPVVQQYFPGFDYKSPAGDRAVLCDMRNPGNMVGHQQRAFSVWWALQTCSPLDLGLDLGSPKGLTPYCIHVDLFGTGQSHPFYGGGPYLADIAYNAASIDQFVPKNSMPFINSNHSLEHMPAIGGDIGIIDLVCRWIELLRSGGVLAMVIPDNDYFDVMASDKDHKHAWGHTDFGMRVLDHVAKRSNSEVVEFDTFDNHFSFNVVLKKR